MCVSFEAAKGEMIGKAEIKQKICCWIRTTSHSDHCHKRRQAPSPLTKSSSWGSTTSRWLKVHLLHHPHATITATSYCDETAEPHRPVMPTARSLDHKFKYTCCPLMLNFSHQSSSTKHGGVGTWGNVRREQRSMKQRCKGH